MLLVCYPDKGSDWDVVTVSSNRGTNNAVHIFLPWPVRREMLPILENTGQSSMLLFVILWLISQAESGEVLWAMH
jgi:hypothetical protein